MRRRTRPVSLASSWFRPGVGARRSGRRRRSRVVLAALLAGIACGDGARVGPGCADRCVVPEEPACWMEAGKVIDPERCLAVMEDDDSWGDDSSDDDQTAVDDDATPDGCPGVTPFDVKLSDTCNDDRDNDGNGCCDGLDYNCRHDFDEYEEDLADTGYPCADGLDNDQDGVKDCSDPDCVNEEGLRSSYATCWDEPANPNNDRCAP